MYSAPHANVKCIGAAMLAFIDVIKATLGSYLLPSFLCMPSYHQVLDIMKNNILPREMTSSYEELLLLFKFKRGLPDDVRNCWHKSLTDLEAMLSKGGFVGHHS